MRVRQDLRGCLAPILPKLTLKSYPAFGGRSGSCTGGSTHGMSLGSVESLLVGVRDRGRRVQEGLRRFRGNHGGIGLRILSWLVSPTAIVGRPL